MSCRSKRPPTKPVRGERGAPRSCWRPHRWSIWRHCGSSSTRNAAALAKWGGQRCGRSRLSISGAVRVCYIRQSMVDQPTHNHESRRCAIWSRRSRPWFRLDRSRGFADDDLAVRGGGIARPGFERLLAAICEVRVGAVLAIEASRLARNGRDWHLIGVLWLVGTSSSTRMELAIRAIRMTDSTHEHDERT